VTSPSSAGGDPSQAVAGVDIFDLVTGKMKPAFKDAGRIVQCLAFSNDGELAALGAQDGTVRFWRIAKGERIGNDLKAFLPSEGMGDLIFTPDAKVLITGGAKGEIKIWNVEKREAIKSYKGHSERVIAFAVSPDGKRFVTAGEDREVKLWETDTGKELRKWTNLDVRNMVYAPDGKSIVTANDNTTLYALEVP
jgi:WD40 repeat protein